jgi:hypothetical protein
MDGASSTHGKMRSRHKILVANSEGKRQLVRPMGRWWGNIKMDLKIIRCEDVN